MPRSFSRWMPQAGDQTLRFSWKVAAVLTLLVAGLVYGLAVSPPVRLFAVVVATLFVATWVFTERRLRRISAERPGDDIGTFAKSFDRRLPEYDPWVIRAVWDALQPYRRHRHGTAPLRPTDELDKLQIDSDELESDVVDEIAERTGRSLANIEANPKTGHVNTVGDLVEFLWHQPKVEPEPSLDNKRG